MLQAIHVSPLSSAFAPQSSHFTIWRKFYSFPEMRKIVIFRKGDEFLVRRFTLHETFTLYEFEEFISYFVQKAKGMVADGVSRQQFKHPNYPFTVVVVLEQ